MHCIDIVTRRGIFQETRGLEPTDPEVEIVLDLVLLQPRVEDDVTVSAVEAAVVLLGPVVNLELYYPPHFDS